MLFKQRFGQTNGTSLVERVSRFTVLLKNPSKRTRPVMGKVIRAVRDLPLAARRSIIFDRGTEFVSTWLERQFRLAPIERVERRVRLYTVRCRG